MAIVQRKIKPALKRLLIDEAGGKCANPGCSNRRVHIHHIKHWAVYKTDDSNDMIAICPACHDAAHIGRLKITDEQLYQWKGIDRPKVPESAHIYVEPASSIRLQMGGLSLASPNDQTIVFELSNLSYLKFRVLDNDLLQVSTRLQDQRGNEFLRVVENHVRVVRNGSIETDFRPGRALVTVPASNDFAPSWLIDQMRVHYPDFAANGRIVALDIEVLEPGLLRVQGCWMHHDDGIVVTKEAISFCGRMQYQPVTMVCRDEGTCTLMLFGPNNKPLFGFRQKEAYLNLRGSSPTSAVPQQ